MDSSFEGLKGVRVTLKKRPRPREEKNSRLPESVKSELERLNYLNRAHRHRPNLRETLLEILLEETEAQ